MRVVHVVTAFPRDPTDPITPWLVELVRRQRAAGLDASVLAPAYRGGPVQEGSDVPVRRYRYAPAAFETLTHDETVPDRLRRSPWMAGLLPGYLIGGAMAAADIGRRAPEVVQVHWPLPHALHGAALRMASRGRTALVCSYYSVEIRWVQSRLRWLLPILRWTVRTADAVTAISSTTEKAVRALVDRPVVRIPYGATMEDEGDAVSRPAFSDEGPLRLLFVGRLVERKGVEILVRALSLLLPRRPANLTIVGEGAWEPRLRSETADLGLIEHVRFTGRLRTDQLAHEYSLADVFVLPAVVDAKGDTEGLGVVLLEALRFERPVVASDVGGIPDVVRNGETGWLVPAGNASALADAIDRLAEDPVRARAVAARGRADVRERFAWPKILAATKAVYESALEERRARRS